MRIAAGLIVTLGLMASATAQDGQALLEAYRAASTLFLGGETDTATYNIEMTARLFHGLDGEWFDIGAVMPEPFRESSVIGAHELGIFAETCDRVGTTITILDAYTAQFSVPVHDGEPQVTTYSSRGGSVFGAFTPVPDVLRRLGLDKPDALPNSVATVLASSNGIATMHRPSPDLLVVQTNYAMPRIYARCPS